jgi:hypothetical protein
MIMRKIVSYWEGEVSWLERLSVNSMVALGYDVEIYTHDRQKLVDTGLNGTIVEIDDVFSPHQLALYFRKQKAFAFYSDYIRLELMRQSKGVWVDLDCVFQKSNAPSLMKDEYVYGWCTTSRINNGVLHLPAQSELLKTYYNALTVVPIQAPWGTPHIRVKRALEIFLGMTIPINPSRLSIGPRALTYYVKQFGLEGHARPSEFFHPFTDRETEMMISTSDIVAKRKITDDTVLVHAWRGKLWTTGRSAPPSKSSWLGQQCIRFGC